MEPFEIQPAVLRIPTKPIEYAKILAKILEANPQMDLDYLARRLSKTKDWVMDRLSLLKLIPEIQKKVDRFEIDLQNAFELARLSPEEQSKHP